LKKLYNEESGTFHIAKDQDGYIDGVNSDSLHSFFYLLNGDIPQEWIEIIVETSKILETPLGYRVLDPNIKAFKREYHTKTVWPFEQAMIHFGAKRFNQQHAMNIAKRIIKHLDTDHETIVIHKNKIKKTGGCPQLWTIATRKYFESLDSQ